MSQPSIGPDRRKLLEVYCACLRRAERRIIIAGQIANRRHLDLSRFPQQRMLIAHAARCIVERGIVAHGCALLKLQLARSKYAAELEGNAWQA